VFLSVIYLFFSICGSAFQYAVAAAVLFAGVVADVPFGANQYCNFNALRLASLSTNALAIVVCLSNICANGWIIYA